MYGRGQVVEVARSRGEEAFIVDATDAESIFVKAGGRLREISAKPGSAFELD